MIIVKLLSILSSLLWTEDIRAGNPIYIFILDWAQWPGFLFAVFLGVVIFLGYSLSFPLVYGSLCMFLNEFFVCYSPMRMNG